MFDAVLVDPVVRVKIWTRDGRILYSDASHLIDSEYELDEEDLEVIDEGGVVSEVCRRQRSRESVRAAVR